MEALNKLQSAINSNSVSSALKNTGFQELTHVVYVPATSPMPSPTPSPASPSPTPSPSSTPSPPSTATPSPGPSPTPPSSPSRSPTGPAGGNKGLQGSSGNDGLPTISEADRSLPGREVARVNIVFGLDSLPPDGVRGQDKGKPVPNTAFNFEDYETQAAMLRVCQAAKEMGDRLAIRSTKCFSDDFKIWLNTKGFQYPLPSREVHALLQEFLILRLTLDYDYAAGFSDDLKRVVWVRLDMTTNLPQKMPAATAWLWKAEWDKFLEEMNRKESSSKSLGAFFHTSTLWVRAETETKLVTTTLLCAVFSIAFALITVVAFLRNLALAVYLVLSIVSVVICLAALMFGIIGWPFGAVEAIGLIVFVGFCVDYSMHLAEAFRQSAGETRFARMKEALQRTGGAIMASAMTSFLAGIPLVFCTIQVFVKFGITVVSNTVLSLLFSLLFFTALLMIAGPMEDPCEVLFSLVRPAKKNDSGDTVPGTVLSPSDGPADEAGGYKWSTGDNNDNNTGKKGEGVDPSEPQKGTLTSPAANESFSNPHLEQPTRVTTPTRRGSNESDDSSLNPVVVGAPQAEAGAL